MLLYYNVQFDNCYYLPGIRVDTLRTTRSSSGNWKQLQILDDKNRLSQKRASRLRKPMTSPIGTQVYEAHHAPVTAHGMAFTEEELDSLLQNEVRAIIHDDQGKQDILHLLEGATTTEFSDTILREVLATRIDLEPWRVGEAIAEFYLVAHRNCSFPWPGGRDLKNPESSPAGTDLVGFQHNAGNMRFSFAEVKTSSEAKHPPSLVHGRHGLRQQILDLRDSTFVKDNLVRYLAYHATGRSWSGAFREAFGQYSQDRSNVAIYGIQVRDVTPDARDCQGQATTLANQCPISMVIELLALYIPIGSITTLPSRVADSEPSG